MLDFDFDEIKHISPALEKLQYAAQPSDEMIASRHLEPLNSLSQEFRASPQALENARQLGAGYNDLVVVLLEPSDKADTLDFDEMVDASPALKRVDDSLRHASRGVRKIHNTIVLDIRPFRSAKIRKKQREEEKHRDDELAYETFQEMFDLLKPAVIVVCQCQTSQAENEFARRICSSIRRVNTLEVCTLPNGYMSLMVKGCHPMHIEYNYEDSDKIRNVLREYMFDAIYIVAMNALAGREIRNLGLINLTHCANDGPVICITAEGIRVSLHYVDESDTIGEQWRDIELIPDPQA